MKICVLTENYGKDFTGAMTSTYELIKRWTRYDIKVIVLTLHIVGKTNSKVQIKKFSNIIKLFHFLVTNDFTHWLGYSDDHFGFLFHLAHIPYLHTYHGNWPNALWHNGIVNFMKGLILTSLYIKTISNAQNVIGVSQHSLKFIAYHNSHYEIIHNGVDVNKMPKSSTINLKHNLKILMVGNVNKRKFSLLIPLLKQIPFNIRKHFQITIYGKIYNQKIYNILKKYKVKFVGFKPKIPYSHYDLFMSTSIAENLSIATVEAISCGIPVITFEIGGMREIIQSQSTGIIIPTYKINLMAKLLKDIIIKGKSFKFNNKYLINDFDWNINAYKYINLFKRVKL